MPRTVMGAILLLLFWTTSSAVAQPDAAAVKLVRAAVEAQGGEARLRAIRTMAFRADGYRNMIEQSERPDGPFIPEFRAVTELHDQAAGRYRSVAELRHVDLTYTFGTVADRSRAIRLVGSKPMPANADDLAAARETLALSPERLLLTALDAADLHLEPSVILQSIRQDVVGFQLDGAPVRIFLNAFTHLPTAVDYSGPLAHNGFWRFRGDVTMRTFFSYWWLGDGGVRMPLQWDTFRDDRLETSYILSSLAINGPIADAEFAMPDATVAKFDPADSRAALSAPLKPGTDIAPGVTLLPGAWNAVIVRQDDGIVVIEAPTSSPYAERVIAEAQRLYKGLPIRAVVTTSDAWPHLAGLRPYVARGIPVYCLDLNIPIATRLIAARYTWWPDALERTRRKPILRPVSGKVTIGSGANQIDLYPIRGETSERQMMAYLPNQRLLYGSDPFQQMPDGTYRSAQAVSELVGAVAREKLMPERFVMMHVGATPWADVHKSLVEAQLRFPTGG